MPAPRARGLANLAGRDDVSMSSFFTQAEGVALQRTNKKMKLI